MEILNSERKRERAAPLALTVGVSDDHRDGLGGLHLHRAVLVAESLDDRLHAVVELHAILPRERTVLPEGPHRLRTGERRGHSTTRTR